jgi:hypothetical protein
MISYPVYKWLHLVAILALFVSLGGTAVHRSLIAQGSGLNPPGKDDPWRRRLAILHGTSLLAILVAGFGLLARVGILWPWPHWVMAKLGIWVVLGGLIALFNRKPRQAGTWLAGALVLGALAAYFALAKI